MFIELTDHLRCPADHPESFLVLVPDELRDRSVRVGKLGCPVCRREFPITDGVARFGRVPPQPVAATGTAADAAAVNAFLGLEGPGGYVAFVGPAAAYWADLESELPGVHVVLVNPPEGVTAGALTSVLEASMIPMRSRSMRGVVLGRGYGGDELWQREAARVTLPGLRVVGEGGEPSVAGLEVLASAGGWWVGRRD